ncbi:MAG TPA: hypothetical protein PLK77_08910 [Pyrinomonadaceae bacterium]|nr:hypothetical protein [Pyrinomonadaceae bacterium]
MINIDGLRANLGELWLPEIYREQVRSKRTRRMHLNIPARENSPEIFHTLLGIEMKVGRVRIAIPDLATARYLCVFARLGCTEVAVPYDISKISGIADTLETGWQRMNLLLQGATTRTRNLAIKTIRAEIAEIGAGDVMPEFNTNTKQRKN